MSGDLGKWRPQLVIVTRDRLRARLEVGAHFEDWDVYFAPGLVVPRPANLVVIEADTFLPRARPIQLVQKGRRIYPKTRLVVMTSCCGYEVLNEAQLRRIEIIVPIGATENLRRLGASRPLCGAWVQRVVGSLAQRYGLTLRESEVVTLALKGERRDEIAQHLGVSPNSIKTLVRRVLRRTGQRRLTDLVVQAYAEGPLVTH